MGKPTMGFLSAVTPSLCWVVGMYYRADMVFGHSDVSILLIVENVLSYRRPAGWGGESGPSRSCISAYSCICAPSAYCSLHLEVPVN